MTEVSCVKNCAMVSGCLIGTLDVGIFLERLKVYSLG